MEELSRQISRVPGHDYDLTAFWRDAVLPTYNRNVYAVLDYISIKIPVEVC